MNTIKQGTRPLLMAIGLLLVALVVGSLSSIVQVSAATGQDEDSALIQGQPFCKPSPGIITKGFSSEHRAIDIARYLADGVQGGPVYAPYDGVVAYAGWDDGGCGYNVKINHDDPVPGIGGYVRTTYCHMGSEGKTPDISQSYLQVSAGERVVRGQLIGYQGKSGTATGPHLHWIVLRSDSPFPNNTNPGANEDFLNPLDYMSSTVCPEAPSVDPPIITIDHPRTEIVAGQTALIDGWAIHRAADSGTGISKVHIYLDGPAGQGGTMIGNATYGIERPDVARVHGDRYLHSGYRFNWDSDSIEPGNHTLYIYAYNTTTNEWSHKTRDIVILPFDETISEPQSVTLTAARTHLPADGTSTTIITATVQDADGQALPNQTVAFTTTLGTIIPDTVTADANGISTARLQAATTPGTATVGATAGTAQDTIDIRFGTGEYELYLPLIQR